MISNNLAENCNTCGSMHKAGCCSSCIAQKQPLAKQEKRSLSFLYTGLTLINTGITVFFILSPHPGDKMLNEKLTRVSLLMACLLIIGSWSMISGSIAYMRIQQKQDKTVYDL